jgi:N-acetylmuramoyl-L-alanine amidase
VALDIGHAERLFGATSANGKPEYSFNRRFAEELALLSKSRADLALIILNPDGGNVDLRTRPILAAAKSADVFLSIHHDSVQDKYLQVWIHDGKRQYYTETIKGYSLFVSERNSQYGESLRFAQLLGEAFTRRGLTPSMHHGEAIRGEGRKPLFPLIGVYEAPFSVLVAARTPAVIMEVGVIVNKDEEALLDHSDYRYGIQLSILGALEVFCQNRD